MNYYFLLTTVLFSWLLSGCSSKPEAEPAPPPTVLTLTIKAGVDINASSIDKAAPLQARLYELTSPTLFQQADFLSLYLEDTATLQGSLVKKHPLPTIRPGSNQTLNFQLDGTTRYIAILAEFSRYQTAVASVTDKISLNQSNTLILHINDNFLRLTPATTNEQLRTEEGKTDGS